MKKLTLILAILLNAILAQSQTTVFNEGWSGKPVNVLSEGNTPIIFSRYQRGLDSIGVIIKYRKSDDEFVRENWIGMQEEILAYRIANGKLMVVGNNIYECDYPQYELIYYEIDTAAFTQTKRQVMQIAGDSRDITAVRFLNDTSLFIHSSFYEAEVFYPKTNRFEPIGASDLSYTGYKGDLVEPMYDGKYILNHSTLWGGLYNYKVENNWSIWDWSHNQQLPSRAKFAYFYDVDSILVMTSNFIYKMDTSLTSKKSYSIPRFYHHHSLDGKLYLLDTGVVWTLQLPGLEIIDTTVINAVPAKFRIKGLLVSESGNVGCIAGVSSQGPLNEVFITDNVEEQIQTERSEISADSAVYHSFVGNTTFGHENRYEIFVTNPGVDTIHSFKVLYSDLVYYSMCGPYRYSNVDLEIPPGATRSFTRKVLVENKGKICFHVSAPNNDLEDDLSDNSTCLNVWLGENEFRPEVELAIYPNPTKRQVNIFGDLHDFKSTSVYSIDGRQMPVTVLSQNEEALVLDLTSLTKGVYFLKLHIGEDVITEKLVKE